jgi:SAM-dependent methyltransferase
VEVISESIYDHPKYYDLVFGSDCAAELKFIQQINKTFMGGKAKRLFEPACGTCRLIHALAKKGFDVEGIDLNEKAVDFGNQRFARHGFEPSAWVADMSDFKAKKKYDLAFNTINSFRHLATANKAEAHLSCMAESAKKNAIYLIGLHLNPTKGDTVDEESWSARRGHLSVLTQMWTESRDSKKRMDHFGIRFDIYTPTRQFRITDVLAMRSYTHQQFLRMVEHEGSWDIEATFDFSYNINKPIEIDSRTEDVVFVLRKK